MKAVKLVLTLMACAATAASFVAAQGGGLVGKPAPSATIAALDGSGTIPTSSSSGLTEIVFVANWCPPCERELRELRRRSGALRRDGYRAILVGVSRRQTSEQFQRWVEGFGFRDSVAFDDGKLEQAFGAGLLPWHVVIDRDGKVIHEGDRAPTLDQLKQWSAKQGARMEPTSTFDG